MAKKDDPFQTLKRPAMFVPRVLPASVVLDKAAAAMVDASTQEAVDEAISTGQSFRRVTLDEDGLKIARVPQREVRKPSEGAGVLVGVRLQPDELAMLDAFRGLASRPEGLRRALAIAVRNEENV